MERHMGANAARTGETRDEKDKTMSDRLKAYEEAIQREVIAPALAALKKRILDDRAGVSGK